MVRQRDTRGKIRGKKRDVETVDWLEIPICYVMLCLCGKRDLTGDKFASRGKNERTAEPRDTLDTRTPRDRLRLSSDASLASPRPPSRRCCQRHADSAPSLVPPRGSSIGPQLRYLSTSTGVSPLGVATPPTTYEPSRASPSNAARKRPPIIGAPNEFVRDLNFALYCLPSGFDTGCYVWKMIKIGKRYRRSGNRNDDIRDVFEETVWLERLFVCTALQLLKVFSENRWGLKGMEAWNRFVMCFDKYGGYRTVIGNLFTKKDIPNI